VRPFSAVVGDPFVGQQSNLLDRCEQIRIEQLVAIAAIETFDEGVLIGLANHQMWESCTLFQRDLTPHMNRDQRRFAPLRVGGRAAHEIDAIVRHARDTEPLWRT
jgi:hypothetical protein